MSRQDYPPADVEEHFIRLARKLRGQGFTRYSARAILHAIRWHMHVEKGDRNFKCNNNWTPILARQAMLNYPELRGFFEIRRSPGEVSLEDAA